MTNIRQNLRNNGLKILSIYLKTQKNSKWNCKQLKDIRGYTLEFCFIVANQIFENNIQEKNVLDIKKSRITYKIECQQ